MPGRARQLLTRHGWLIAIAVAYLYVFPYFPRIQSANELPRVYLVKAIVHDHSFAIDNGVRRWGGTADVSPFGHHQYSNKAPGSSLIVVPVYAAVNAIAGEPSLALTMWLCRIVAGVVPSLLFLLLLSRFLVRYAPAPEVRRLVLVAYALGSLAMTYTMLYFSHQLAAVCIASAWILAIDVVERSQLPRASVGREARPASPLRAVACGLLAGAAPLVDYQASFAGVPIAIYLVVQLARTRRPIDVVRTLAPIAVGAAIPVAILLWYHSQCFGGPLRTGYDASQTWAHFHQQGFLGITQLRAEAFWGSLLSPDNGLLVLSPWLLLAIPGGIVLWRRGDRATVLVVGSVATIFVAFISSITFWRGGWGIGPRYITAMLPFLLPLVAVLFTRIAELRRPWIVAGIACAPIVSAIVIYCGAAITFPYWPDSLKNPLYEVTFRLIGDGAFAPNVLHAVGVPAVVSIAPLVLVLVSLVVVTIQRVAGWRGLAIACVGGAAIVAAFAFAPRTGAHAERAYTNTVYPAVTR